MEEKNCLECNKIFNRKTGEAFNRFTERKYCSHVCSQKSRKGTFIQNNGLFKKGVSPWNKGRKGYMSEEGRKRISESTRKTIANEPEEKRKLRIQKAHLTMKKRGSHSNGRLGNTGEKDPNWIGEKATYNSKHKWIQKHWVKTEYCEICKKYTPAPPGTRLKFGTQWANISNEYKRIREDWLELCPKCHRNYDHNK